MELEAGEPDLGHTPALHDVEVLLHNAVDARFTPVDAAAADDGGGLPSAERLGQSHDEALRGT
jgi:hypothetical protein